MAAETVIQEFARIRKNKSTEIRVHISLYRGRRYLVLREFFEGSDAVYRPGRAGINVGEEHHEAVLAAVKKALEIDAAPEFGPRKITAR